MKTITLLSLAAGAALLPTMALAQPAPRAGGGGGVTWRGGGAMGGGAHVGGGVRGGHVRGGGGHFRGGFGGGVRMPHFRPGHGFPRRLTRGAFIHPFWFGPQFFIQNWQGYGFADPGADRRWVRYYDDAYLIDQGGRIVDAREGLDWDQYGERWEVEDGVPSYYGRNQYQPDDEDYAYVDQRRGDAHAGRDDEGRGHHDRDGHQHGGGTGYGHAGGGAYGGGGAYAPGYGGPMPVAPGGAGMAYGGGGGTTTAVYGGGYGYGMYAYPIIIETTTTTVGGSVTYSEEIIEEVVQTRRARRRARGCNCRPARPPAGERG